MPLVRTVDLLFDAWSKVTEPLYHPWSFYSWINTFLRSRRRRRRRLGRRQWGHRWFFKLQKTNSFFL